jgi:hypothetical protein
MTDNDYYVFVESTKYENPYYETFCCLHVRGIHTQCRVEMVRVRAVTMRTSGGWVKLVTYTTLSLCCERVLPNKADILTVQHPGLLQDTAPPPQQAVSFIYFLLNLLTSA